MNFPFTLTQEIRDAYQAHIDYTSAGQKWLLKNDPDCYNEHALLEEIQTAIQDAAELHFGDNEDALEEFVDEFEVREYQGVWYEIIEELEPAE
jgi:hypothetical protein